MVERTGLEILGVRFLGCIFSCLGLQGSPSGILFRAELGFNQVSLEFRVRDLGTLL